METEEVCCFGMIVGLQFKSTEDYKIRKIPIHLQTVDGSRNLLDSDTKYVVGVIDQSGQKILEVLGREITLQLFADFTPKLTTEASRHRPNNCVKALKAQVSPSLELCAVLYGHASLCNAVGIFAAKCHLYLQNPKHCDRDVPYRNPQCLSTPDGRIIYTSKLVDIFDDNSPSFAMCSNPIDLFADTITQDTLADAETPRKLSTALYKHQKQALTFMTQRERGWALHGLWRDIWKEMKDYQGRVSYQNIVSGLQQIKPPRPFAGGLLIDAPGLGKSLSILALVASNIEAHEGSTQESPSPGATLVIVPKTLIQMWEDEIQKHLRSPDALAFCVYYGKDRENLLRDLGKYKLVITTYSVVRLDWKTWLHEPETRWILHSVTWERIVLDEAHIIREPSKSFAKSVCALKAEKRWAVTGTPIQNRLLDLFSLFKFLQCSPFDDLRIFNAQVTENWKSRSDPECIAKLKTLVNCLSLRRPKDTIALLPRRDETEYLSFNMLERENYQQAKSKALMSIGDIGPGGQQNATRTFMNALRWVNELRLICNHGPKTLQEPQKVEQFAIAWSVQEAQTRFDQLDSVGLAKCSDLACGQELSSVLAGEADAVHDEEPWISKSLEIWCSVCARGRNMKALEAYKICHHLPRRSHTTTATHDGIAIPTKSNSPFSSLQQTAAKDSEPLPSKVRRILQDLLETPDDVKRFVARFHDISNRIELMSSGSVVFSAWTKTLKLIKPQLMANSIRCVLLDGSLSASGRAGVLRVFRTNPGIKVLLATITCGGVGLDLTAASRAYIMEPQWNPMSESQAMDRLYRLGQEKEVTTIRYIMKDSFEEQVLRLQRRKQELADLTLHAGALSKAELTYGRLQYLKDLVR